MNIYDVIVEMPVIDNHTHPKASFFASVDKSTLCLKDSVSLFSIADLQSQMKDLAFREILQTSHGIRDFEKELLNYQHARGNTAFERLQAEIRGELHSDQKEIKDGSAPGPSTRRSEPHHGKVSDMTYEAVFRQLNIKKALVNDTDLLLQIPGIVFWVPYLDQFIFIKDNTPYKRMRFQLERIIGRYEAALENTKRALGADPVTFSQFLEFIDSGLMYFKQLGCPAMKIHCAYARSLRFNPVSHSKAEILFEVPSLQPGEYKDLQDFLMRFSLERCIAHGLPVQIHTGMGGPSSGLFLSNANCCNLQDIFIDDELRQLKVVILHGGYPFFREAGYLASNYANVYLDFSWLSILFKSALVGFLEEWLDIVPYNKLLFGTDAWTPEHQCCGVINGKRALAQALKDELWGKKMAIEIARAVLYNNAAKLYGL